MKVTGIVRRIDDLGRIVIPKEIRKVLKIRCGDSIEIFINENNNIELNKFSLLENQKHLINTLILTLKKIYDVDIILFNDESIIGYSKKNFENIIIEKNIYNILKTNEEYFISNEYLKISNELIIQNGYLKVFKIYGDILGGIIAFSNKKDIDYKKIVSILEHFLNEIEN